MPELPEVETMVRGLRPVLEGKVVREATVIDEFLLDGAPVEPFEAAFRGATVNAIARRGKWVVIDLQPLRGYIVVQPRMTGGFWLVPPPRLDHARLMIELKRPKRTVWFCDARRLGKLARYETREACDEACDKSLGPDALAVEEADLAKRLKRTARAIKPALMDQKILAGLGNIYAEEVLHLARIHPERPSNRLDRSDYARIHGAIRVVLEKAILAEGSSFDAGYRTVLGLEGGFLAENAVYGREGRPCGVCGASIVKTYMKGLIGRPTHFCPRCQIPPRSRRPRRSG